MHDHAAQLCRDLLDIYDALAIARANQDTVAETRAMAALHAFMRDLDTLKARLEN